MGLSRSRVAWVAGLFASGALVSATSVASNAETTPDTHGSGRTPRPQPAPTSSVVLAPSRAGLVEVPFPALASLEPTVAGQLRELQSAVAAAVARSGATDAGLADAYGALGQLYHAYKFLESAEACYRNAADLDPQAFEWRHLLGHAADQAGDLETAARHYEAARALNPVYAPTAVRLGGVYVQLGRLEDAERQLQAAIDQAPEMAAAHHGLGQVAMAEGRYADAVAHVEAALARLPSATRLHYELAMAYRQLGRSDEARAHLERQGPVGVRPADPLVDDLAELIDGERVQLIRGRLAFRAERFGEAASLFRRAVAADPGSARARINLAASLARLGDDAGARAQLEAAVDLDPNNPTAGFNLGALLARAGEYPAAIDVFEAVVRIAPRDIVAWRGLVSALQAAGRETARIEALSSLVALDPADEESVMALASLLVEGRRYQEAIDLPDWGNGLFPRRPRTGNALARLLAACPAHSVRNGARGLQLAMALYQAQGSVAHGETVAMALAELGRCGEAAEWQRRLVVAADREGQAGLAATFREALSRYEAGAPCRAPPLPEDGR